MTALDTRSLRLGDGAGADAYLAAPTGTAPAGAVIVVPDLYGFTDHARGLCDRLAGEGHLALTLDLYWRQGRPGGLPFDAAGRDRGLGLLRGMRRDEVLADLADARASADALAGHTGIAIIGLSLGGTITMVAATRWHFDLAVTFYGGWTLRGGIPVTDPTPPMEEAAAIAANGTPVLGFVGDLDPHVPPQDWREIGARFAAAGVDHDLVSYPGVDHAFFCADQPAAFDAAASADAWERLRTALARSLRAQ
ncbi:dienelactone hydrolase family protein [Solihabitans fulvus]|uniref:Dienelactone hydrolase family protein n=1 Tax=Solihabitans fulvus TaxID=1892852 RepID=A0A5B2XQL2_9PSEU|nr:dienelactone hydrolase family protein [Solihabitans fulvus]KAA2265713.1 dienelactone hydrolase family protein [Solihabitans fulvus]